MKPLANDPDAQALAAIQAVQPCWSGVRRLADVCAGSGMRLYHAGPPFRSVQAIPRPVLNSMAHAILFERWAPDFDAARAMVLAGLVQALACQDANLLVPLAGVLSPSMAVLEIASAGSGRPAYVAINEGQTHALRLGRRDEGLQAHVSWLNTEFADWLAGCLAAPIPLLPLMAQALEQGDDCHARTLQGSALLCSRLHNPAHPANPAAQAFLSQSPAFALNLWMGAAALCLGAAEGIGGATLVTRVGGNGAEFGIQLAGNPGVWVCERAPQPVGSVDAEHQHRQAAGALGDSAVVDFLGLGGQALAQAPQVYQGLQKVLPSDVLQRSGVVLQAIPSLPARPSAVSALRCQASALGPLVLLGMIDESGTAGRIGGGCLQVPDLLFQSALQALRLGEVRDAA